MYGIKNIIYLSNTKINFMLALLWFKGESILHRLWDFFNISELASHTEKENIIILNLSVCI